MLKQEQVEPISEIFFGICDRCKKQRDVVDISDNPIHTTTRDNRHIDICIICADCMKYFLNRMRRMIGEKEIA